MSAASRLGIFGRLPLSLFSSVFGWLMIAPVFAVVPKRRDWVAVIGRQDGRFLDNAKYFLLQAGAVASGLRFVFVTEREELPPLLAEGGRECLRFPNISAIWFLMRCGTVVVDEAAWFKKFRFFLLIRAHALQLWHGVGCKWVEAELWRHQAGNLRWASHPVVINLRLLAYRVTGRRMRYAAVACTSAFYRDQVFQPAFVADSFPIVGYPRNDCALSLADQNLDLAWSNVDAEIKSNLPTWKRLHRKLVLVAPTFRESGFAPMPRDSAAIKAVNAFAEAQGVEFIFKFHPSERNTDGLAGRHFHVCARDSDIYPVMPHLAALVTDYSSISMDFLLVGAPLIFLIPEDDDYVTNDRQLQFDPRNMMPGPIVSGWPSLLVALASEWEHDHFVEERAVLRRKAFDDLPQAEAVPKLIALMRERGWVRDAETRRGVVT